MTTTFYMVEMYYPASEDRAAFDGFYHKHISMLLSIPGFRSAQRYECESTADAPFLAVYRLEGPGVLESDNYTSRAGRTSVDPVFRAKMTNWDRNLAQGDIVDMDLGEAGWMVLIDRLSDAAPPLPEDFTPLAIVGLDATIRERGVRLGQTGTPRNIVTAEGWRVRTFRPVHPPRHPG